MSVVFLHAIALDRGMWRDVAVAGELTPDLPGHGIATPLDESVTFELLVEHVARLLDGPADFVGLSLGSMLAQHIAIDRPELVRSLVLACGGMYVPEEVALQRAEDTLRLGMAATIPSTLERWFSPEALAEPDHPGVTYARRRLLDDDPKIVSAYWSAIARHDLRDRLHQITAPTTVIAATGDKAFPVGALRGLADAIPGARYVEITGPHILALENPIDLRSAIDEHLSRIVAQATAN